MNIKKRFKNMKELAIINILVSNNETSKVTYLTYTLY